MNNIDHMKILKRYLYTLNEHKGSDLHIKSNAPIRARINEEIVQLSSDVLHADSVENIAREIAGKNYILFMKEHELDSIYVLDDELRFRVNMFVHLNGLAIVFRLIPKTIRSVEELNLPQGVHQLCELKRGLVFITGTTGSGKSTTLASVIEEINTKQARHIITIEDPVEYVYSDKKCIIEQRGIGHHTHSFNAALRSAMREDPDIIVVGELRDIETAESVLHAVNTGQLVFTTLHTTDARETIDRLIAIFPTSEQNRVRMSLASNLKAVISQRLIRSLHDELIPAVEMMFISPRIEYMIRAGQDADIPEVMAQERHSFGSVTFNQALFDLALAGEISEETAFSYATSASDLKLLFTTSTQYQELKDKASPEEIHLKDEEEKRRKEEAEEKEKSESRQEALHKLNEQL
ncbi:type IV pilus twitching motility protein PilT [Campylobacterota bacterium]